MQKARAILFDTRSIQRYIFSDNRLKTNIGASYIVSHVFEEVLFDEVLSGGSFGLQKVDTESWKKGEGIPGGLQENDCYVAYAGGGNALLLFSDKGNDTRKDIVSAFTEKLLVKFPGLKTGAALGELTLDSDDNGSAFQESLQQLYDTLKNNQFTIFPRVNVANTGLTVPCEVNGEAANAFVTSGTLVKDGKPRFFSQEVVAKARAAAKADDSLRQEFADVLGDYDFPKELEQLGQKESENDIAVVHIDGNNMGSRFQKCAKLEERGRLSRLIADNTQAAFRQLLKDIVEEYNSYGSYLRLQDQMLPIRPLILGGDDITFICNARLALVYTKRFMEYLEDEKLGGMAIDSCAGIAIVPTAYPFFRAYELAEQLCDVAKKSSRKIPGSSWLDFAILHGEQAPTIEQIRAQEYKGALGNMHFGPYRVDGDSSFHFHIEKLLAASQGLQKLPRNKWKELRNVLQRGEHDMKRFVEQLHHDKKELPHIPGWEMYEEDLWNDNSGKNRTPYVDAIEIIDYIPPREKEAK